MSDTSVPKHRLLHSFCVRPEVRFESQNADETILLLLRAHPFTQLIWLLHIFFMGLILFGLNFLLPFFLNPAEIIFFNIFFIVIIVSYAFFRFLGWYFNVGIVTDQRIVDMDYADVVYREISEAKLERIVDMTSKSGGFFESFFDYGDLFVQTPGTEQNIEFHNIPDPALVISIINGLLPG